MTNLKRTLAMLVAVLMMASAFTACSNKETNKTDSDTTVADDISTTITEEEAIELVKQEMGEDYSYIPADELEEIDGNQYYVIYVKRLLEAGNYTTIATYLVKTDGSEVYDKDANELADAEDTNADTVKDTDTNADTVTDTDIDTDKASYVGEYVKSGETGETTFTVSEDGYFEMTTVGDVNQTVTGRYKFGITNSAGVIKLKLYPQKSVVGENEEEFSGIEGTAVIENGTLTLEMESEKTVFTKK